MVTMALYTLSHADFDHYYKLYCTASGLSLPEGWHFTLGGPHKVTIDLYQLYQAVVLRGGIAYDASDPEWRGLAQASMIASTSATAMPTPVAMRSIYQGRIRGFLDFMADLVRQYNAARKEAGIKEEEDEDDDDDFYYGAGAGYTVGRGRAVRRPHVMRGGASRSGARAGGGHSRSGQRLPGVARIPQQAPRSPAPDVPDPVPGDRLRSMATWLRGAVLGFAEKPYAEVTSTNSALGRRYRSAFARLTAARTAELPPALFPLFGARASVPAPRRSGRTRAQRTARGSSDDEDQGSGSEGEAEIGVIRVGRYAQAVLPEWHPMPPPAEGATESEARRLEATPLYSPDQAEGRGSGGGTGEAGSSGAAAAPSHAARAGGGAADTGGGGSKVQQVEQAGRVLAKGRVALQTSYADFAAAMAELGSEQQRQDLLRGALLQLDEEMGPDLVEHLGLTELGCKLRADWTESDEALFALGMLWFRRPNKSVQRKYLPHKTLHQLQSYYYNVWKLRGTQLADLYYEMEPYVRKTATDRRLERSEAEKRAEVYEARVLQLLAVAQLNVKTEQGQPLPALPVPAAGSKRGAGGGSGGGSAADRPGSGGGGGAAAARGAAAAGAGADALLAAAAVQPVAAAVGAQRPAGSSKRPSSAADNDSGSKGGEVASKRAKTAAAAAAAAVADGAGLAAAAAATPAAAGGSRSTRLTLNKSDPGAAAAGTTPATNGKGAAAATADAAAVPAPDGGGAAVTTSGRRSRSSAAAATPSTTPAAAAATPGSTQAAVGAAAADPRRSYSGSYSKLNDWDVKAASKLTRAQMAANERRALRKALSFVLLAARDPSGLPPRYNLAVQLPRLQRMRDLQISQAPEEWQTELAGATEQGATAAAAAAGTSGGTATRSRGATVGAGAGEAAGAPAASRAQPTRSSKRQRQ